MGYPMEAWDEFLWNVPRPSFNGIRFLCEPADPPVPLISPWKVWLALELQMWKYYILASLSDQVKPLFVRHAGTR